MQSQRKNYLWNSLAGLINAAEVVVMSMIVTRYGQLSDAGVLSLAFAVGNVMMTIGKFGGRMFQVTDAKRQYTFRMYLVQRCYTVFFMLLALALVLMIAGYSTEKRYATIIITIIFATESWEESFWGYYQSKGRLYIGAQMFATRWIAILIVFSLSMVISGDMIRSLLYGAILGCVVFVAWLILLKCRSKVNGWGFTDDHNDGSTNWLLGLFRQTIPLFFASFGYIFISGIPKFAINRYMTDEIQACYGFVAMPVFVIGMLNQFIYQPTVVKLTQEYNNRDILSFRKGVKKQVLIVMGISAVCVVVSALVGIPILTLLYHTDLSEYRMELVILQIAGGFLALSAYFTILFTLMRKQWVILVGYAITVAVGMMMMNTAVRHAGTVGASVGYALLMVILCGFYTVSYSSIIRDKRLQVLS